MNPQKSLSLPPQTSPSIPWGSPALRPNASFPPMNYTPPHRPQMQPIRPFAPGTASPQLRNTFTSSFRTPQPQVSQRSPNTPRGPWSENRGYRVNRYQHNSNRDSPCDSPSMNPGGSDNILHYYSPAMMTEPWFNTPPRPVEYWKTQ